MKKHDKPALRNWTAAANPLLRKGGVHQKTRKSERKLARQGLRRDARRDPDSFSLISFASWEGRRIPA